MNPYIAKLNTFCNTNPYVRPLKWRLMNTVYAGIFELMQHTTTDYLCHIYGMRRTGNHAIINWLVQGLGGSVLFCNDVREQASSPLQAATKRFKPGFGKHNLIVSYEDVAMNKFEPPYAKSVYGDYRNYRQVLILRDPFNLLASRYVWRFAEGKAFRENPHYRKYVIGRWKDNARVFLKWKAERDEQKIAVNYNRWTYSTGYREALARQLGMQHAHRGIREVKAFGGGSSFEGTKRLAENTFTKESENRYTTRFRALLNNEDYRGIFKDSEIMTLSQQIFGTIPGTESF